VLQGRDVIVGAQTGTGKTASFALPVMQLLAAKPAARTKIRTLVLTPTRELAAQVEESFRIYGRHLSLKSTVVFGGVGINPQIDALRRGVDILVATPGRLLDHVRSRTVDLSGVEILVLDEADRMLDMGFIRDIRKVLEVLPKQRQNLFFSATFSKEIRQLADSFLRAPAEVAVAHEEATADLISQLIHPVDKGRKRALLSYLIGAGDWKQVLVFTRTKHGANRLAEQLEKDGISASAIHGNKSQGARTRALAGFKSGEVRVLVATDIAARGLDIEQLPHVVNYELPNVPEDYVHRIGRTGRAGSSGVALSLVCSEEHEFLRDIERLTGNRIERRAVAGFEPGSVAPEGEEKSTTEREPARQRQPQRRSSRQGEPRQAGQGRGAQGGQGQGASRQGAERDAGAGRDGAPKRRRSRRGGSGAATGAGSRGDAASRGRRDGAERKHTERKPAASTESAQKPASGSLQNAMRAVASLFGGNRSR
jgi:ATP-dependent RNA helicase RhlE